MHSSNLQNGWMILDLCADGAIVYDAEKKSLFAIHRSRGFCEYSFEKNLWIKHIIKTPLFSMDGINRKAIAIDSKQQKIYVDHSWRSIAVFTLDANNQNGTELRIINNLSEWSSGYGATGIVIDGELHRIGGDGTKHMHIKYNPNTNRVEELHDFRAMFGLQYIAHHQMVRIKDDIWMFGGNELDLVHQYNISTNKWVRLKQRLPRPLSSFGCTVLFDGEYVAIFGGESGGCRRNEIFIYTIRDKMFRKSRMKCPKADEYRAFTIKDRKRDDMSSFGYVRCYWRECGLKNHLFPPEYLIRIVAGYCFHGFVHLISINSGYHYKIDVLKLIDFC